jgi:hypothetical protein
MEYLAIIYNKETRKKIKGWPTTRDQEKESKEKYILGDTRALLQEFLDKVAIWKFETIN